MTFSEVLRPASPSWSDRLIVVMLALVMVLLIGAVSFAAAAYFGAVSAAGSSQAVENSQTITSCRSEIYSAVIDAQSQANIASHRVQSITSAGLLAAVQGKDSEVGGAASRLAEATALLDELDEKAAAAAERYTTAAALANDDPVAFLKQCAS